MRYFYWRDNAISQIVLGTAQLGFSYGISNTIGKPQFEDAEKIIIRSAQTGINFIDTAQGYGDSEELLGRILIKNGLSETFSICTKFNPSIDPIDEKALIYSIFQSLKKMSIHKLWGVLLHRAEWIRHWNTTIRKVIHYLKNNDLISYFGVSVYTVEDAMSSLSFPDVDFIQIPCNVWDQRMVSSGVIQIAENLQKLCFVRSIYLQGLLSLDPDEIIKKLPAASKVTNIWKNILSYYSCNQLQIVIQFAQTLGLPCIIGMEHDAQVVNNVSLFAQEPFLQKNDFSEMSDKLSPYLYESIYNPSLWSKK